MSLYISETGGTESLRFLHLAQASTRRLTLVRGCIAGNRRRVSTAWQRAPHGGGRKIVESVWFCDCRWCH